MTANEKLLSVFTDEELAFEAKRRGYRMTKVETIKRLPCVCGGKRTNEWFSARGLGWSHECNNCGLKAPWGKTKKAAKIAWNNMIEQKMAEGKMDEEA